jgi:calcineurin-like phosphoesterase family protein
LVTSKTSALLSSDIYRIRFLAIERGASMRKSSHARNMKWRLGHRKPAHHLFLARIPDKGIADLIASFPRITGCAGGESRDPHVTLFGPFLCRDYQGLPAVTEVALGGQAHFTCQRGDLIRLKGLKGGAVAFELDPGAHLLAFYQGLVQSLGTRVLWCTWIDKSPGERRFHISLRFNIPFRQMDRVWEKVTTLPRSPSYERDPAKDPAPPLRTYLVTCDTPIDLFRVALMRRGCLFREYDLPRRKWLSRGEALDSGGWVHTREAYRKAAGLELVRPAVPAPGPPYVIADLHLGHRNIIDYCRRPFSSAGEMDRVLIRNWNFTVQPGNEVYFLGDLRHGLYAPPATQYLPLLSGTIHPVIGNHDRVLPGWVDHIHMNYEKIPFLMIHDPAQASVRKGTWIIHGHHHNNHIALYPFINTENRTINVSAELVNYTPVSLGEICGYIRVARPGEHIPTLNEARTRYRGPD